jgi:Transport and Golgi organisation 2
LRILAIRDELVTRPFDPPASWWPEHPTVIGGRDRLAGGSWCVSDVVTGRSALVLNGRQRRDGAPSRGTLPLAAVGAGESWTQHVDYPLMASFLLVLATPSGMTVWDWDQAALSRVELGPGTHMITTDGLDPSNPRTSRFAPLFASRPWYEVVTSATPSADMSALVVRREVEGNVYGTVFGQLITASAGELRISWSATPWTDGSWTEQSWP